eukprot:364245-Chlamydomonas_euryale.AAC.8
MGCGAQAQHLRQRLELRHPADIRRRHGAALRLLKDAFAREESRRVGPLAASFTAAREERKSAPKDAKERKRMQNDAKECKRTQKDAKECKRMQKNANECKRMPNRRAASVPTGRGGVCKRGIQKSGTGGTAGRRRFQSTLHGAVAAVQPAPRSIHTCSTMIPHQRAMRLLGAPQRRDRQRCSVGRQADGGLRVHTRQAPSGAEAQQES